jgi:8-oxo-dGTP pyrophosphatase MutT (NUDIX family)
MLNEGPPVEPRPAASVLLLKGARAWQVLMIRRPEGAEFAPGAYVFPGGSVHPEDEQFADRIRAAAVRELFEEVGVLLARRGRRFAAAADASRLRGALSRGTLWPDALAECGLSPAHDRLAALARWITPEPLRRRFDTWFFVARMPPGQTVEPQPGEVVDWTWIEPVSALADGEVTLVYATRRILESVASEREPGALIRRLRRRKRLLAVRPRLVNTPSGWEVVH